MAKRSVELQIQLQNAKSINDLDLVLRDINKELKNVDVNSEAFNELSQTAKQADKSLRDVKEELKGISDEKQLDSVAKIGGSLAAGLSVATLAANHFGEQTSESIQKSIQTATELTAVISSIKPIVEGLSSSNRKAFAEYVKGFKESALGAKFFGNTTKAAIASTGIGLLVIALGLLIANWESVTKAVRNFAEGIPVLKAIMTAVDALVERVGSLSNLFAGIGAFIKGVFTVGADAVEEFNKAIEKGKAIDRLTKEGELIKEQNEERARAIKLLEAQGRKEVEILDLKKQSAQSELDNLLALQSVGAELSKDQEKRIRDLQLELELLAIQSQKALDAARRAAWEKENAEAQRLLNISDLQNQIAEADAEKEKERYAKMQQDLLNLFKERKEDEIQIAIEGIEAEETEQVLSAKRQAAILDQINRIKLKQNEKYLKQVRDEEIKYLKETENRTLEQDDVLAELRFEKFQENLEAAQPYIDAGLQGINMAAQAITDGIARSVTNIENGIERVNNAYQESAENRKALEAQLSEATGIQREQLLASIEEERSKERQLADERKKLQNEKVKAENKANTVEWANSLVNAVVAGALSVARVAYNPVLATIVGVLAAAQVGIIAANKPQPIPTFAQGGFTSGLGFADGTGHEVAGVVHAGEYVIPANILNTGIGSSLVQTLEAMRLGMPTFASGGFASPPTVQETSGGSGLDANAIRSIIESSRIFVSVQEVREVQTNVDVIESRAAIAA